MKKTLVPFILVLIFASCTYKKGELAKPVQVCDSVIHTVPVTISDNFFNPSSITILAGDTVKWDYTTGSSAHTSTCDGNGGTTFPSGGTIWDSGVLLPGGVYKKAIMVPGTYMYICKVHGMSMMGTINVNGRCK